MMMDALVQVIETLARKVEAMPIIGWATVTDLDPLRIQLGGESEPLAITPSLVYRPQVIGERVLILTVYRRCIILGRAGGMPEERRPVHVALTGGVNVVEGQVVGNLTTPLAPGSWLVTFTGDVSVTPSGGTATVQIGLTVTGADAAKQSGSMIVQSASHLRLPMSKNWLVEVPSGGTVAITCELLLTGSAGVAATHSVLTAIPIGGA